MFQGLYSNLCSDVIVNGRLSPTFPVNRGVRQGCPLSPMIFVLCLDPLLRRLQGSANIRGFVLPNGRNVVVSAYADDITLFVRDRGSLDEAFRVFDTYADVSGAKLNSAKSKALAVGGFSEPLPRGIGYYSRVKFLGVLYDGSGVAPEIWPDVVEHVRRKIAVAERFDLSLREKAFLIKCVFLSKLWYISRVMLPPSSVCAAIMSQIFPYFWGSRIELVRRDVLQRSRSVGGWSLPCVGTFSKILALRAVLQVLDDVESPARVLILYWLGPSRRVLVPRGLGNAVVAADTASPFYSSVIEQHLLLQSQAPQVNVLGVSASRLSELLFASSAPRSSLQPELNSAWQDLTSSSLPFCVSDFQWRLGWGVLPTRDRLHRRRVTSTAQCPNCSLPESNIHVVSECVVARTFWSVVARMLCVRYRARRSVQSRFSLLVLAIGRFVLWRNRCRAVAQGRRIRQMYPLLSSLRLMLVNHLEDQFVTLGEAEFLRRWSTRFVEVAQGRVVLKCRFWP